MSRGRILAGIVVTSLAGAWSLAAADVSAPAWVPWPKSVKAAEGFEELTAASRIATADAKLAPLASVLAGEIYLATAAKLRTSAGPGGKGDITLRLSSAVTADEGYRLTVGPAGILVEAKTCRGAAWGTATLLQAIENAGGKLRVPRMTVEDEPVASYRGLLIDCGRQWHPVESMRPVIEMCRLYKINYLQLHLNDNTEGNVMAFPSKAFPQLATDRKGNRTTYTLEEITGLVKYADERGVTLVPELSGPGAHAGPMRLLSPRGNTIDVWNEATYEKLAVLFAEVAEVFKSSPWIHLGGDEGSFGHLGKSPEEQTYMASKGVKNPLNYYLRRMDEIVKKNGKKTICWEGFGGDGGGLPKDILVMPYESQFNTADKLVKHGFSVINTAWKPLYVVGGRKWEPEYIYDSWNMWLWEHHINTKCHIQLKETDPVIGAQICAWEQHAEVELPSTRTRIPALSERTWNPKLGKTYADYAPRAASVDSLLNKVLARVNFGMGEEWAGEEDRGYRLFIKPLTITLIAPPIGSIRYTRDGKEPTAASTEYKAPFAIKASDTHFEKLFYNRRVGAFTAEGYVCTLKIRLFDSQGAAIGDCTTIANYWYKGAELAVKEEGLSGEKEGNVEKFKEALTVTLSAATPVAIRYTLNGKAPTKADAAYGKPLVLTHKECKTQGILFSKASKKFAKEAPVVILRAKAFDADGNALPGLILEKTYWYTGSEPTQPADAPAAPAGGKKKR
ncbi:MAG: family 20 glycosylhydrolase [bacterium]